MSVTQVSTLIVDDEHPYLGLDAFDESHQAYFYGRKAEHKTLYRMIQREVLTVVFGTSGLGKTSLLNASIFPQLRTDEFLPIRIRLLFDPNAPPLISQVKQHITTAVAQYYIDTPTPSEIQTIWEYCHRHEMWSQDNRLLTPVIVFDQFEEIFTLGQNNQTVSTFIEAIGDMIENRIPKEIRARNQNLDFDYTQSHVKVVICLREDYLPQLEELRRHIPTLAHNRYRLTVMHGQQALNSPTTYSPVSPNRVVNNANIGSKPNKKS